MVTTTLGERVEQPSMSLGVDIPRLQLAGDAAAAAHCVPALLLHAPQAR